MIRKFLYFFVASSVLLLAIFVFKNYETFFVLREPHKHLLRIEGRSMEPAFSDGDYVVYDDSVIPAKGDVIYFSCIHASCHPQFDGPLIRKEYKSFDFIKRIEDISPNGCYTVVGDNADNSYDSRYFGRLCPWDIVIHGVVIQKATPDEVVGSSNPI